MVNVRPKCPWYSDNLRSAKRHKRRLERKFRKSKLEVDRQIYLDACKSYRRDLNEAKRSYHNGRISGCNSKQLFRIVDSLTNPNSDRVLPTSESPKHLANEFANYFDSKIQTIRGNLDASDHSELSVTLIEDCDSHFGEFRKMSEEDVRELIMQSPVRGCSMDPIPTPLLKEYVDSFVPVITRIMNLSLTSGEVPTCFKLTKVTPLIKKKKRLTKTHTRTTGQFRYFPFCPNFVLWFSCRAT